MIQNSQYPTAWYAALDIILPAIEQDALAQEAAVDSYNSLIGSIAAQYASQLSGLTYFRQTSLQAANDAFWTTFNSAEQSLTDSYNSAMSAYYDATTPAAQAYDAEVQSLQSDFDEGYANLYNSGGGNGGSEEGLWETMLTGEIAAWNTFVGVRQSAWGTFTSAMDSAVDAWTQTVDAAYVTREDALASIRSSTDAEMNDLNAWLESELQAADDQFQNDWNLLEQNWASALSAAHQAYLDVINSPNGPGTSNWHGPENPSSGVVADAFVGLWGGIRGLGQQAFDSWESMEWETWRVITSKVLADKRVADTLFDHSLSDNPPNLAFPAGHFVSTAITGSPEFAAKVAEILQRHTASGPGTYADQTTGITFNSGDFFLGIHDADVAYTLVLNADHTYTLNATLKDTYDFSLSWDYYRYSFSGVGATVAANIAWADQHLQMIETYDWTATLPPQTGTW